MNRQIESSGGNLTRRNFLGSAALAVAGCTVPGPRGSSSGKWYRGQLHCHTLWSDGRALSEQAIGCYRDDGYDFVSVTDHNRLSLDAGQWRPVCKEPGPWPTQPTEALLANALPRFPWLQTRSAANGGREVRLTPFRELQAHFNDPGRFLLMPGVEVTRARGNWGEPAQRHVHMTYANLDEVVPNAQSASLIQGMPEGDSVAGIIRRTYGEIMSLSAAKGQAPGAVTLCHPHWTFHDVLPQDLIDNPDVRFFEVCNGGGVCRWRGPDARDGRGVRLARDEGADVRLAGCENRCPRRTFQP